MKATFAAVACLFIIHLPGRLDAQFSQRPGESFYFELIGNTGAHSFNFDLLFSSGLGFRAGAVLDQQQRCGFNYCYTETSGMSFVMTFNRMTAKPGHRFETGFGIVGGSQQVMVSPSRRGVAFTGTVGYRYQPEERGFVFRAGFTPAFTLGWIYPRVGVSLGYAPAFNR